MASVCPSTQWIFLQELQSQSSELQAFERVFGFDVAEPQCQAIASKNNKHGWNKICKSSIKRN